MLSAIVAMDENRGIGKNGQLLCHIKEDLQRFKKTTINSTIIMGRKTFEALPFVLPHREHIVITNDRNFKVEDNRVSIEHNLSEIIEKYSKLDEEVFIIGGEEIFKQCLKKCNKLYITEIYKTFEADVFMPDFNKKNYNITYLSEVFDDNINKVKYKYIDYELINI